MHDKYSHADVERVAQTHWQATDAYRAVEHDARFPKGKYYCCSMLPYPSGKLHMGHVRNYTINDVMYRQLRMQGYNVLMPMGWDAFGLPAENAAMANQVAPGAWTWSNIDYMKQQMKSMGLAIDWSREVATCSPDYYRWNQWLFLRMLEKGVAYLKTGTVNWDPVDQTVLANEQVIDGRGWRSGALVEKREIPMYYLRITQYAEELIRDLEPLGWPERVKLMQDNWIGRSVGVRFAFDHAIRDSQGELIQEGRLFVFTTRADTIMGVTFVAVAPEHPLAQRAAQDNPALTAFIEQCQQGGVAEADIATREKEGMATGLSVKHPITGAEVPVWVGNYVLMSYGDGAVMGVPAHDERDHAFANKYGLEIRQVIQVPGASFDASVWQAWYGDKTQGHCIHSGFLDGKTYEAAVDAVAAALAERGAEKRTQYRLRDWGISRQRYWGTPIPIIHCPSCGAVPVPDEQLPVTLPDHCIPDGSGNPLNHLESFLAVDCPRCGTAARRETDTMDTFIDSSWYYMRYCSPDNSERMVDERNDYWMPMDQYIGGIEHAVLHLLYARFWTKFMRDLGLVKFSEPFSNLLTQGMVNNETYYREDGAGKKTWYNPVDITVQTDERGRPLAATLNSDGNAVVMGGIEKMSKSKNNGVDPQELIDRYGADTARLFTMFAAPPEQTLEWSGAGVDGAQRFLRRWWSTAFSLQPAVTAGLSQLTAEGNLRDSTSLSSHGATLRREVHSLLKQADFDYQRKQYNTVVSAGMKLLNTLDAAAANITDADHGVVAEALSIMIRMLYPIVPHIAHGLWNGLGFEAQLQCEILNAPWPTVDSQALIANEIDLVVQINGKTRGSLTVPAQADRASIEAAALASELVQRHRGELPVKKVVVVPGRLVNVVI